MHSLAIIWAGIIAFGVIMYIILDGCTLGIGLLFPFLTREERDIATSVILPTWDGNQTWLVLGGASLYGAFPLAFSALLPVLYIPIMIMVLALLFRGVALEFRLKTHDTQKWDLILAFASCLVSICQGYILGEFVEGFVPTPLSHVVRDKMLISVFTLFCVVGVCSGYMLLGATRMIAKTRQGLQDKMVRLSMVCLLVVAICLGAVSLISPTINILVYNRWFANNNWLYLMILPYLSLLALFCLFISLYKRVSGLPFVSTVVVFICGYLGFIISIYPYIVPYHITIWQAASPENTLQFLLIGAVFMLPILLGYTAYSYYVFRGKVDKIIRY